MGGAYSSSGDVGAGNSMGDGGGGGWGGGGGGDEVGVLFNALARRGAGGRRDAS